MNFKTYAEKYDLDPQCNFAVMMFNCNSVHKLSEILRKNQVNHYDMVDWKLRDHQHYFDAIMTALTEKLRKVNTL